jgi:hypothetical protein
MSNLIGGLLLGGFFTYCYFSNHPDKAKKIVTDVSWYVVSRYHRVTMWYGDTFKIRVEEDLNENMKMKKKERVKFHGYSNGNIIVNNVNEEQMKDLVEKYEVCFVGKEIGNKLYFKRLENVNDDFEVKEESEEEKEEEEEEKSEEEEEEEKSEEEEEEKSEEEEEEKSEEEEEKSEEEKSEEEEESGEEIDETMVPCMRHFLQVECIINKIKYDIHEHISKYYITNNVVMDEIFMKYFMKQWYDVELDEDYELKIIDKNINLVTLEKDSKILLGKDEYKKLK